MLVTTAFTMVYEINNKVVIVTGGAEGLGLEMARSFLEHGAKVLILDINEKHGQESVKTLCTQYGVDRAVFYKCDVRNDLDVLYNEIINKYKIIDVLINNAGILNESTVKETIDINVTALICWSLKFWEHMRTDKGGRGGTIINIASIYGFRVDQYLPVYQASKFAVFGFTKSLGHNYNFRKYGVRVVAVCPGFTETKLVVQPTAALPESQSDFEVFVNGAAWQQPKAVGDAAVEVYQNADSGTAWLIEGGKPIQKV